MKKGKIPRNCSVNKIINYGCVSDWAKMTNRYIRITILGCKVVTFFFSWGSSVWCYLKIMVWLEWRIKKGFRSLHREREREREREKELEKQLSEKTGRRLKLLFVKQRCFHLSTILLYWLNNYLIFNFLFLKKN